MRHDGDGSENGWATHQSLGARYTIPEAAETLGITEEAVRQRVKRGSLDSLKVGGRLCVLLNTDTSNDQSSVEQLSTLRHVDTSSDVSPLVERLEDEVLFLRRELEGRAGELAEMRRIVAALTSRIPQLEAPSDAPGAPETVNEDGRVEEDDGEALRGPQVGSQRRVWWLRWLLGGG